MPWQVYVEILFGIIWSIWLGRNFWRSSERILLQYTSWFKVWSIILMQSGIIVKFWTVRNVVVMYPDAGVDERPPLPDWIIFWRLLSEIMNSDRFTEIRVIYILWILFISSCNSLWQCSQTCTKPSSWKHDVCLL